MKNKVQNLQSVFPATTASAVTAFYTGLTAQEHGITGWDMNLKEFGTIVSILPLITAQGQRIELSEETSYFPKSIFDKIYVSSYKFGPGKLFKSDYNKILGRNAEFGKVNTFNSLLNKITKTVKASKKKKYIYAYWPDFDSLSHEFGKNAKQSKDHLKEINNSIEKFSKRLQGTNTLILITADHGQIITTRKKTIVANEHKKLKECLSMPMCGEPRVAYCYVYPRKVKQFENYVKTKLNKYCTLYKAEDFVKAGYFGLGKAHPRLLDRIGDYVLLMKDHYIIKDFLINEEIRYKPGCHGGNSEEEMVIPLIKLKL